MGLTRSDGAPGSVASDSRLLNTDLPASPNSPPDFSGVLSPALLCHSEQGPSLCPGGTTRYFHGTMTICKASPIIQELKTN